MAALDFPDTPTNGQVYDKWTWNGTQWVLTSGQQQHFMAYGSTTGSVGLTPSVWARLDIASFTAPTAGTYRIQTTGMFGLYNTGWIQGGVGVDTVNYATGASSRVYVPSGSWAQLVDVIKITLTAGSHAVSLFGWTDGTPTGGLIERASFDATYHGP